MCTMPVQFLKVFSKCRNRQGSLLEHIAPVRRASGFLQRSEAPPDSRQESRRDAPTSILRHRNITESCLDNVASYRTGHPESPVSEFVIGVYPYFVRTSLVRKMSQHSAKLK
jgi:hypothetical protein